MAMSTNLPNIESCNKNEMLNHLLQLFDYIQYQTQNLEVKNMFNDYCFLE